MTALALLAAALLHAAPAGGLPADEPLRPKPKERCPVCGMFVAKYPEWVAAVAFRDGTREVFDGAKDLFRFWFDPSQFLRARRREDATRLLVTDYYSLAPTDAREAFYVVGSDVLGPMGHELVPFATRAGAEEFLRDHHGKRLLRFAEVTPELVRSLDG